MNKFDYNFHIDYSKVDNSACLGLDSVYDLFQISLTEFFKTINFDNFTMKEKFDSAWVIVRSNLHINRLPLWGENITSKSYFIKISPLKVDTESAYYDKDGKLLFVVCDELCAINLVKRRLIKLTDIGFKDFDVFDSLLQDYGKCDTNDLNEVETIKVRYRDIDATNHTNNVSYIRYIINNLDKEFFDNNKIEDVNLHYIKESLLGDSLSLCNKVSDNNIDYALKKDGTTIFTMNIKYTKL